MVRKLDLIHKNTSTNNKRKGTEGKKGQKRHHTIFFDLFNTTKIEYEFSKSMNNEARASHVLPGITTPNVKAF